MKDLCASCRTNCCENYTVYINGFDLYRIVKNTGLDPSRFVSLYDDVENNGHDYHFTLGQDLWVKLSLTRSDTAICYFLEKKDGVGRCAVHSFRPNVCRGYPYCLDKGKLHHMKDVLCPGKWRIKDEEKRAFAGAIENMNREYYAYNRILQMWNRRVAQNPDKRYHPGEFVNFLLSTIDKARERQEICA